MHDLLLPCNQSDSSKATLSLILWTVATSAFIYPAKPLPKKLFDFGSLSLAAHYDTYTDRESYIEMWSRTIFCSTLTAMSTLQILYIPQLLAAFFQDPANRCVECCFGIYASQTLDKQVGNVSIPGAWSVWGQRILLWSGLVVIRSSLLRMHLQ